MADRYVGIKNGNIYIVSNYVFTNDGLHIIKLPSLLEGISSQDLITNYKFKNGQIMAKSARKPAQELKIALVSNYGTKCGIATYSKFLYNELTKLVGDYKLFIERDGELISDEKIIPCWKRGESLLELINEIKKYDPDIVLIQHEFGLWPNARYWLSLMNQLSEFRIIITMHSIYHHRDKTIVEAAMPEIIVHLQEAADVLQKEKGITGKVHVIKHGCFPCLNKERLWNFYQSEQTFITAGFGFRYKGFSNSIIAVSILKQKYPNVFFTALFSESPHNMVGHQIYYNELMILVEKLGVQENVAIIRGFQSEEVLDSYLRTNKVAVFPYAYEKNHECFGASGQAPLAMSKNIPVITSDIHHFRSLPSIKAGTPEEIAKELDKLFSDSKLVQEQLAKQEVYLLENSWKNTAERYIKVFES